MSNDLEPRELSIRVRVSVEERDMLRALSAKTGLSASDWIRQEVRKAHAKLAPDKPARGKR